MVIMDVTGGRAGRRSRRVVLAALALSPALLTFSGCASRPSTSASGVTDAPGAAHDDGAVTPLLDGEPGEGRALVSTLEAAADTASESDAPAPTTPIDSTAVIDVDDDPTAGDPTTGDTITGEGTDSVTRSSLVGPPAGLRSNLIEFGSAYLEFDYRLDQRTRTERFRGLTSEGLFEELAAPLPPVLAERLVDEQRVVLAEFVSIEPVDVGVYQLAFTVTESSVDGDGDGGEVTTRTITIAIDPDDLVSHVS